MTASRSAYACVLAFGWLVSTVATADSKQLASEKTITIERQGNRLTARIVRVPLRLVVDELRRQAGIHAQLLDPDDNDTVSETFSDKPLVEGIAQLLNGRSFLIEHLTARIRHTTSPAAPLKLVILPRVNAVPLGNPIASTNATTLVLNDLTQAMVDPDETVRARAQERFEQTLANISPPVVSAPEAQR